MLTCKLLCTTGNELLISNQTVCLNGRGSWFHSGAGQGPLHSPSSLLRYTHACYRANRNPYRHPHGTLTGKQFLSSPMSVFCSYKHLIDFVAKCYFYGMNVERVMNSVEDMLIIMLFAWVSTENTVFFKTFFRMSEKLW